VMPRQGFIVGAGTWHHAAMDTYRVLPVLTDGRQKCAIEWLMNGVSQGQIEHHFDTEADAKAFADSLGAIEAAQERKS
jgi:hypothetical protein